MKDNTIPSSENSSPDFDSFIHSIRVIFPPGRLPFTSQFQVLNKTIQAYKEGSDALIESPTGTGKAIIISLFSYYIITHNSHLIFISSQRLSLS